MDEATLKKVRGAIRLALEKGLSRDEVSEFMMRSGYAKSDIDTAFAGISTSHADEIRKALDEIEIPETKTDSRPADGDLDTDSLIEDKNICQSCGFANDPGSRFCGGCGKKL